MFSHAVGREGHCRQMSLACVGSTHSVLATLGLPPLAECALPLSILLRLPAALQGAGPEVHALPRPKPLRFRFLGTPQRHTLGWACVLCLPCPRSSGSQEPDECTLPRCNTPYPLRSPSLSFWARQLGVPCVCYGELDSRCNLLPHLPPAPADVDHPESQEVFS